MELVQRDTCALTGEDDLEKGKRDLLRSKRDLLPTVVRDKCALTGEDDLEKILEIRNFPIRC
jgi:hypothetical protein